MGRYVVKRVMSAWCSAYAEGCQHVKLIHTKSVRIIEYNNRCLEHQEDESGHSFALMENNKAMITLKANGRYINLIRDFTRGIMAIQRRNKSERARAVVDRVEYSGERISCGMWTLTVH